MGVPAFYRWLVNKYPKIVVRAVEEKGGCNDSTLPNPNGIEFDNLYLDMNGIIHPCFHPDDDHPSAPTTFDDVFNNIYQYIDHLFSIVRPRKLLFLAIDGVAPRAKMNQQRSRRFRTALDNEIAEAEEEKLRKEFDMEGKSVLSKLESEVSDSNVITPGTEFMFKLSTKLQEYLTARMETCPGWTDIKVILSDANVPGEGEHKIMSYIRHQRALPHYNPNTRHCLYGLDADLIMLALATHEIYFSILREDVLIQEQQSISSSALESRCRVNEKPVKKNETFVRKPYEFLNIWTLREYLELDMKISATPENFSFDLERIIDDFIFLCFFAGNDFLPHMPTLEIHEGAIDLLMTVYKENFKNLGGYLVQMNRVKEDKDRCVKLKRVEKFILQVGAYEEKIFKKRSELRDKKLRRLLEDSVAQEEDAGEAGKLNLNTRHNSSSYLNAQAPTFGDSILENTKQLKEKLRTHLRQKSDLFKNGGLATDRLRLGCTGWRERYYNIKFSAGSPSDTEKIRKEVVQKYTEGLLWVLLYYFSGVPSWSWFYPYHYGPFASDLKGMASVKVKFQKGSPFKPFDQLLAVLPPRSAHALPKAYSLLMTNPDSNIIDFYPTVFQIDSDGKRFAWQGVCKLPFIDEERLLAEGKRLEKDLVKNEAMRNVGKVDNKMFVRRSSISDSKVLSLISETLCRKSEESTPKDDSLSGEMGGTVSLCAQDFSKDDFTTPEKLLNGIKGKSILRVLFELPEGVDVAPHLLEGIAFPSKSVTDNDIQETRLWHENTGSRPTNTRFLSHERRGNAHYGKKGLASDFPVALTHSRSWVKLDSNSCSEVTHRGAGTGWGAGRRRGTGTCSNNFREHIDPSRKGSCWNKNPSLNKAQNVYQVNKSPIEGKQKVSYPNQHETRGIQDLKISEPTGSTKSYAEALSVQSSFVPSRNSMKPDFNNSWHQNLPVGANVFVQRAEGARWRPTNGGNHAEALSVQNSFVPSRNSNDSWHRNLPIGANAFVQRAEGAHWCSTSGGNYAEAVSVQSSFVPSQNSNNSWHPNLPIGANAFVQRTEGAQWCSTSGGNSAWKHSTHLSTNPTNQAAGSRATASAKRNNPRDPMQIPFTRY